jgi:hypothetical protein
VGKSLTVLFTAITEQPNHKEKPESVAKQRFQVFPWFGFERKALQTVIYRVPSIASNCRSRPSAKRSRHCLTDRELSREINDSN